MKHTTMHLVAKGYQVLDLTWFLNKKSVKALTNTLQTAHISPETFVVLIFSVTKFKQEDDTVAIAARVGGEGG